MKLRTILLCYTAAIALSAGAAFAAIDGNQLADDYIAEGYTYVEVKVGPTQTKVEAIKDGTKVEVVYDNETGAIITQESEPAGDDANKTGTEVTTVTHDFEGDEDHHDGNGHDDDDDDGENGDDDHGGGDDHDSGESGGGDHDGGESGGGDHGGGDD